MGLGNLSGSEIFTFVLELESLGLWKRKLSHAQYTKFSQFISNQKSWEDFYFITDPSLKYSDTFGKTVKNSKTDAKNSNRADTVDLKELNLKVRRTLFSKWADKHAKANFDSMTIGKDPSENKEIIANAPADLIPIDVRLAAYPNLEDEQAYYLSHQVTDHSPSHSPKNGETTTLKEVEGKKEKKKKRAVCSNRELRNLLLDAKALQRKRTIPLTVPPPSVPSPAPSSSLPPPKVQMSEEMKKALEKLLQGLRDYHEHSYPFLTRVRKVDAPDYYDIITRPMDLSLLGKNLRNHVYPSRQSFLADLQLIFDNCRRYNTDPSSAIYLTHAAAMEERAKELLKNVPEDPQVPEVPATPEVSASTLPPPLPEEPPKLKIEDEAPNLPRDPEDDEALLLTRGDRLGRWEKRRQQRDKPFPERDALVRTSDLMGSFVALNTLCALPDVPGPTAAPSEPMVVDAMETGEEESKDEKEKNEKRKFYPEITHLVGSLPALPQFSHETVPSQDPPSPSHGIALLQRAMATLCAPAGLSVSQGAWDVWVSGTEGWLLRVGQTLHSHWEREGGSDPLGVLEGALQDSGVGGLGDLLTFVQSGTPFLRPSQDLPTEFPEGEAPRTGFKEGSEVIKSLKEKTAALGKDFKPKDKDFSKANPTKRKRSGKPLDTSTPSSVKKKAKNNKS